MTPPRAGREDPRSAARGDPRSAARGDPRVVGHARELLRLAETGEIDCLLYVARRAPTSAAGGQGGQTSTVWRLGAAGDATAATVADMTARLRDAALANGGHTAAAPDAAPPICFAVAGPERDS